jgi:acetolactate synthase-1/2/3 large subunit
LILGCRLNIRQIGYGEFAFAPRAWKAHVDADPAELHKPTLDTDMRVQADLKKFMPILREILADWKALPEHAAYTAWCRERVQRYPVAGRMYPDDALVNPYFFMDKLFARLRPDDVVVTANATAAVTSMQCGFIQRGMRVYSNSGDASMGYDLPAAIGAAIGGQGKRVICLAGDGSIMMNLQELQTIIHYNLLIIIFILNNNGYHSIRQTQQAYFPDNLVGLDPASGVTFPDFMNVIAGFGLAGQRISTNAEVEAFLDAASAGPMPACYEVMLDPAQHFEPKLSSRKLDDGTMVSARLEDMSPFLPPEELRENIL